MSTVLAYIVGTFSLAYALAFTLYGARLCYAFGGVPSAAYADMLAKVGAVTVICLVCFSFRALVLFVVGGNLASDFWLSICYFTGAEIIPSALMLGIYSRLPGAPDQYERLRYKSRSSLSSSEIAYGSFPLWQARRSRSDVGTIVR